MLQSIENKSLKVMNLIQDSFIYFFSFSFCFCSGYQHCDISKQATAALMPHYCKGCIGIHARATSVMLRSNDHTAEQPEICTISTMMVGRHFSWDAGNLAEMGRAS